MNISWEENCNIIKIKTEQKLMRSYEKKVIILRDAKTNGTKMVAATKILQPRRI